MQSLFYKDTFNLLQKIPKALRLAKETLKEKLAPCRYCLIETLDRATVYRERRSEGILSLLFLCFILSY